MKQVEGLKAVLEFFDREYSAPIREISYCEGRKSGIVNYSFLRYEIIFECGNTTDFVRISVVEENGKITPFVM